MRTTLATPTIAAALVAGALAGPATAQDRIAEGDMQRFCAGMASQQFGVNPRYIRTQPVVRNDNNAYLVYGEYDVDSGVVVFECRFGPGRRFKEVHATGPTDNTATASPIPDIGMSPDVSNAAVEACMGALDAQTDGNVEVVASEFSQANSAIYMVVGPQRAPWQCLVANDGRNPELMYIGRDGE